jgi:hypothetical protein
MRRPLILSAAAAAVASMGLVATPAIAQQSPQGGVNPVVVSGVVTCSHAGPVGRQAVTWTVDNASGFALNLEGNATETGTIDGNPIGPVGVEITPNPIPVASHGTGGDGPFGGTSTGNLTLVVSWNFTDGEFPMEGSSTGTVALPGGCVNEDPTTTSTSTTIRATTTVAPAVVSTPRFTG